MHSIGQQQLQHRSNSTQMPLIYPTSVPPAVLLQTPTLTLPYNNISMQHYQHGHGNRSTRDLSMNHRQQRPITGFRHHPYQLRQPLLSQRSFHPTQSFPHSPATLMGTPPGMSQSEYERIHFEQVQRDKEKLVRHGHVLAPSNTTQFLIHDHNPETTPSTDQTNNSSSSSSSSSSSNTEHQSSLTYDEMFEMNDDDTESIQNINIDTSFDEDFNDIYYQCRYERYAAFSRTALLNEVLSLCANIDRLQHEKSEVEKHLSDVQQRIYDITTESQNQNKSQTKIESNKPIIENISSKN